MIFKKIRRKKKIKYTFTQIKRIYYEKNPLPPYFLKLENPASRRSAYNLDPDNFVWYYSPENFTHYRFRDRKHGIGLRLYGNSRILRTDNWEDVEDNIVYEIFTKPDAFSYHMFWWETRAPGRSDWNVTDYFENEEFRIKNGALSELGMDVYYGLDNGYISDFEDIDYTYDSTSTSDTDSDLLVM